MIDEVNKETMSRIINYVKSKDLMVSSGLYTKLGSEFLANPLNIKNIYAIEALDVLYKLNVVMQKVYDNNKVNSISDAEFVKEVQDNNPKILPPFLVEEIDNILSGDT